VTVTVTCVNISACCRDRRRVCVCPSVTRWHWVKTNDRRIMRISPSSSPRTLHINFHIQVVGIHNHNHNPGNPGLVDNAYEGALSSLNWQKKHSEHVRIRLKRLLVSVECVSDSVSAERRVHLQFLFLKLRLFCFCSYINETRMKQRIHQWGVQVHWYSLVYSLASWHTTSSGHGSTLVL